MSSLISNLLKMEENDVIINADEELGNNEDSESLEIEENTDLEDLPVNHVPTFEETEDLVKERIS